MNAERADCQALKEFRGHVALPKLFTQSWPGGIAPDTEARIAALSLCSTAHVFGLQCGRMMVHPDEVFRRADQLTGLDALGFLGSPILFMLGLSLIAWGGLLLTRKRSLRTTLTGVIQVVMLAVIAIETAAQVYFYSTGQTLDWPLFADSALRLGEMVTIGGSSVPVLCWWSLGISALLVSFAPWLAGWYARRRKANLAALARIGPFARALCLSGVLFILLGYLPTTALANDAASPRDPILNLIATSFPSSPSNALRGGPPRDFFRVEIERAPTTKKADERNVVFILLESTRADGTTIYNPELQTTPYLAELAKKSLVFDRMQAGIPATKKALRHILCGFEASHSVKLLANALGAMVDCLPNLLRQHGYRSFFMQSADEGLDFRASSTFSMGFEEFIGPQHYDHEGFEQPNAVGWDDESMLEPSRSLLKRYRNQRRPFIAAYLTVDAHFQCKPMTRRAHVTFSDRPDYDCYLNALRDDDFFVHELIRQYEDLGLLKNTLFVILADHGEAFGEHGRRTHNDIPWQEGLHVPALIYDPNGVSPAPGHLAANTSQIDLAPTVAELLGFQVKSGHFQGRSLLVPQPPFRIIHSACYGEESCLASLQGDLKYIDHQGRRPDELFDLKSDPREQNNLAAQQPKLVAERKLEVRAWDEQVRAHYAWFERHLDEPLAHR